MTIWMKKRLVALSAVLLLPALVGAEPNPAAPASAAMDRLSQIMSKQSLTAKAQMSFSDGSGPKAPMEFLMVMSQGKSRMEMDMAKMAAAAGGEAGAMPPGLDKMVIINRPDLKVIYQVMPGLKAYAQMPIPQGAGEAAAGDATKVERKVLGSETLETFNCEKVLYTLTDKAGVKTQMQTWEAKELMGLPVKMETTTPEGKMTMRFTDIKTTPPAASLFEPPAGATKYASMQEMMMQGMMKMMQNGQ